MKLMQSLLRSLIKEEIQLARRETMLKEQQENAVKEQILNLFKGLSVADQMQLLPQLQVIQQKAWEIEHGKTASARKAVIMSPEDAAALRRIAGVEK